LPGSADDVVALDADDRAWIFELRYFDVVLNSFYDFEVIDDYGWAHVHDFSLNLCC
jgi:hypothetical protein